MSVWKPEIRAAFATRRDNFCVALMELEYDDPFSAILIYDGQLPQPWGRIDVQREITSVIAWPQSGSDGRATYAALSNEGDVYKLGQTVRHEEIPGAGVLRPGGQGAMYALGTFQGDLIAVGTGNLIFRQKGMQWERVRTGLHAPQGYLDPGFAAVEVTDNGGLYVCGSIFANTKPYDITSDPRYSQDMSPEAMSELFLESMAIQNSVSRSVAGFGSFFDGTNWLDLGFDQFSPVNALHVVSAEMTIFVGTAGLILTGNPGSGFSRVSSSADSSLNLLSVTVFQNETIVASDRSLHIFNGHVLSSFKPRFGLAKLGPVPTPMKIQTVDNVLFYFDYKHGVHRFDGENWEEIVIPPELLEREFKGLPPRQ